MKLGMRKAITKASVAAVAPNTWLMAMSRASPSTRETMVIELKDSSPRSMEGRFMGTGLGTRDSGLGKNRSRGLDRCTCKREGQVAIRFFPEPMRSGRLNKLGCVGSLDGPWKCDTHESRVPSPESRFG